MNTMALFVWLLPILFMVHEFEEIIMIEVWHARYKEKIDHVWPQRKPFGLDHVGPYLTPTINIGIFVQFIPILLICLLCAIIDNYYVWVGFTIGFVIMGTFRHVRETIRFKGYMPGIITTALIFFPLIWILVQANTILHYNALEIVLSTIIVNGIFGLATLKLLHGSMPAWTAWLIRYSRTEDKT
jgi:hypothetical protein